MSLTGSTTEEKIWNFLSSSGFNDYGVAGLMGNLYAESALNPKNLQNSYESSLGYTDSTYTTAVDNGTYSNFASDSAGYGLVQWTYKTRKAAMLEYHQSLGKSIGDLETQLEFMVKELKESYSSVYNTLKTATSVLEASNAVLKKYENPANQSTTVQNKRASYGEGYYSKYASSSSSSSTSTTTTTTTTSSSTSSSVKAGDKLSLTNCPLYKSSTTSTASKKITGTYYIWSNDKVNDRYRITNLKSRVGVENQVTGWIDSSYAGGTSSTGTSSITAGKSIKLSKCPLYAASTSTTKANTVSGTYYIWSSASKNGRYRITTNKNYVGVNGKVTGWVDSSYIS